MHLFSLSLLLSCSAAAYTGYQSWPPCNCGPDAPCWPSDSDWDALNTTVEGRLIRTTPIGSVCHDPTYNESACASLKANWTLPQTHIDTPSSVAQQFYTNDSCSPFDAKDKPCAIGAYVRYAIDVREERHVRAGIRFAQTHSIRLVIRNTGHDFNGRSTGYGALALWMHHVTGVTTLSPYRSPGYTGPAAQILAGEQVGDMITALHTVNQVAMGGACPTVGVAGGYIGGGGHGPLSSSYGMAADQVLEWRVILAGSAVTVTASPTQNQDLYWALSGGGAGTYGVVWSVTVRTFPDFPVGGATLSFGIGNHTRDDFWKAVDAWHAIIPACNDAGGYGVALYNATSFQIRPFIAPRISSNSTHNLFAPLLATLDTLGIPYNYTSLDFPSFVDAYQGAFPQPWRVGTLQWTSRLIPREMLSQRPNRTSTALRQIWAESGASIVEVAIAPSLGAAESANGGLEPNNSVLPAWRDTALHYIAGLPWNDSAPWASNVAKRSFITQRWTAALKELAPTTGAYMNEADANDPDWKQSWFGDNYDRLLQVKKRYDPDGLFYAPGTVGSDAWNASDDNGLLCRVWT